MLDYVGIYHCGGAILYERDLTVSASGAADGAPVPASTTFLAALQLLIADLLGGYKQGLSSASTDTSTNESAFKSFSEVTSLNTKEGQVKEKGGKDYKDEEKEAKIDKNTTASTTELGTTSAVMSFRFQGNYTIKAIQFTSHNYKMAPNSSETSTVSLLFFAVHLSILPLNYVGDMLNEMKTKFLRAYNNLDDLLSCQIHYAPQSLSNFLETNDLKQMSLSTNSQSTKPALKFSQFVEDLITKYDRPVISPASPVPRSDSTDPGLSSPSPGPKGKGPVHNFAAKKKAKPDSAQKGKEDRVWEGGKTSKSQAEALDFSKKDENATNEKESKIRVKGESYDRKKIDFKDDDVEDNPESDDEAEEEQPQKTGMFGFFSKLVSGKTLEAANVDPILSNLRDTLNERNVAAEISEKLTENVRQTLIGMKIGTFSNVRTKVKQVLEEALLRILNPDKQVDLLAGIQQANEEQRPYSIVFVGVNGVGKSTSLAKIANYLLSKNLTVGVAACDTFRAGAIEQLETHTKKLGIPLYARGYDKDAANVAREALIQARRDNLDVVLVDTAGRMQNNIPLMRALVKLIAVNRPDLILFVGEGLVGNDAVNQVTEFNKCLDELGIAEYKENPSVRSGGKIEPRLIDGIVLTKFDTLDDKVGAAISLSYSTRKPIVFVGTGQTYDDLRRMKPKTLIQSLLK